MFTLGALGHLFCPDAIKGEVLWEKNVAKEYQVKEFTGITASPFIEDEVQTNRVWTDTDRADPCAWAKWFASAMTEGLKRAAAPFDCRAARAKFQGIGLAML